MIMEGLRRGGRGRICAGSAREGGNCEGGGGMREDGGRGGRRRRMKDDRKGEEEKGWGTTRKARKDRGGAC